jgi:hypothetical protein
MTRPNIKLYAKLQGDIKYHTARREYSKVAAAYEELAVYYDDLGQATSAMYARRQAATFAGLSARQETR